jgi:hypothetical protein
MNFAENLCEAVYCEAAAWALSVRLEWRERGWPLPEHWPYSLGHAQRFLRLPPALDPAVTSWLAALVDRAARYVWARQELSEHIRVQLDPSEFATGDGPANWERSA